MTNLELVLNMLAEASTKEISRKKKPQTFDDNKKVAQEGGHVAGVARKEIESKTGENVVTPDSYLKLQEKKSLPKKK